MIVLHGVAEPLPDLTREQLESRIETHHALEREARRQLGRAVLRGLAGTAAREELRRVREALDADYAAMTELEQMGAL